jgi:hypothetical protein
MQIGAVVTLALSSPSGSTTETRHANPDDAPCVEGAVVYKVEGVPDARVWVNPDGSGGANEAYWQSIPVSDVALGKCTVDEWLQSVRAAAAKS